MKPRTSTPTAISPHRPPTAGTRVPTPSSSGSGTAIAITRACPRRPTRSVSIDVSTFVWQGFMNEATAKWPETNFARPDGLTRVAIDAFTGMRASPGSPSVDEWFIVDTEPTGPAGSRHVRRSTSWRSPASRRTCRAGWRRIETGSDVPSADPGWPAGRTGREPATSTTAASVRTAPRGARSSSRARSAANPARRRPATRSRRRIPVECSHPSRSRRHRHRVTSRHSPALPVCSAVRESVGQPVRGGPDTDAGRDADARRRRRPRHPRRSRHPRRPRSRHRRRPPKRSRPLPDGAGAVGPRHARRRVV